MSKKQEFCVNTVIAKVLQDYNQSPTFEDLKAELRQHTYGRFKWKLVEDLSCPDEDPKFNNVKRILFVNEASVIIQDVEMIVGSTRFDTHKIMLKDWNRVFIKWAEERSNDWNYCWNQGARMYGADV